MTSQQIAVSPINKGILLLIKIFNNFFQDDGNLDVDCATDIDSAITIPVKEDACTIRLLQNANDFGGNCYVKFATAPRSNFNLEITEFNDDVSAVAF